MIDFNSSSVFKLSPIPVEQTLEPIRKFLIPGEELLSTFKTVRDQVVFTNKRIIAANVQGMMGAKVDYTSMPYSKIQTFSVEIAGGMTQMASFAGHCGQNSSGFLRPNSSSW